METDEMKNDVKEMEREVRNDLRKKVGRNPERKEGPLARAIESQTARIPSDVFLWTSVGAMAASLALMILGKRHSALFIGQWTAPFLLFGVYNKLVKVHGHEKDDTVRPMTAN